MDLSPESLWVPNQNIRINISRPQKRNIVNLTWLENHVRQQNYQNLGQLQELLDHAKEGYQGEPSNLLLVVLHSGDLRVLDFMVEQTWVNFELDGFCNWINPKNDYLVHWLTGPKSPWTDYNCMLDVFIGKPLALILLLQLTGLTNAQKMRICQIPKISDIIIPMFTFWKPGHLLEAIKSQNNLAIKKLLQQGVQYNPNWGKQNIAYAQTMLHHNLPTKVDLLAMMCFQYKPCFDAMLIDNKSDITKAFGLALKNHHTWISPLYKMGANVSSYLKNGQCILHCMILREVSWVLVREMVSPELCNHQDNKGNTPMHILWNSHYMYRDKVIQDMIPHTRLHLQNQRGRSIIDLIKRSPELVQYFLPHMTNCDITLLLDGSSKRMKKMVMDWIWHNPPKFNVTIQYGEKKNPKTTPLTITFGWRTIQLDHVQTKKSARLVWSTLPDDAITHKLQKHDNAIMVDTSIEEIISYMFFKYLAKMEGLFQLEQFLPRYLVVQLADYL